MNQISVQDFWTLYSINQIEFKEYPDLSRKLSLNVFFDRIFGKLTRHKIVTMEKNQIQLQCLDCPYINNEITDVCDTHIGILRGQFNREYGYMYSCEKTFRNNICHLKLTI